MHIFLNLKQQQQTAITILHYVQQLKRKKEVSSTWKKTHKIPSDRFRRFHAACQQQIITGVHTSQQQMFTVHIVLYEIYKSCGAQFSVVGNMLLHGRHFVESLSTKNLTLVALSLAWHEGSAFSLSFICLQLPRIFSRLTWPDICGGNRKKLRNCLRDFAVRYAMWTVWHKEFVTFTIQCTASWV